MDANEASSRIVEKSEDKSIEIDGKIRIQSVAFVVDEGYLVGGDGHEIRRWRIQDGKEVGQPMCARSDVLSIAVSRDRKRIVSGTYDGQVAVWGAENHKTIGFRGHKLGVFAVDVSPDGTRIATGSYDFTVCVWSLSTGELLLGPFEHNGTVAAVKISPDGHFIATATWSSESVRVYDNNGHLLVDTPIQVGSSYNQSLAWADLGKELFALSEDGNIHCIDVATRTTLSKWAIHANNNPRCIALASDGAFIAASDSYLVSFWDVATHKQIGPLVHHPDEVRYVAISANGDLAIGGGKKVILRKLPDILPSSYFDHVCVFSSNPSVKEILFTMDHLQQQPDINDIRLNFPRDLTGHFTKFSGFPVASGSYGDIYKGSLNVRGGSIDVRHCLLSHGDTSNNY